MISSFHKVLYHGLCASAAIIVASSAMLPVSAATANALSFRGGQSYAACGCHDQQTTCTGNASCSEQTANACLSGPTDTNGLTCGVDSNLCISEGCNGADVLCGSR